MSQGDAMAGDGFEREIRFAVVMYGGVSLAVYMNGIAQELLRMVRATAPEGDPADGKFRWRIDDPALDGTERVYRRLGGQLKARFIVDIISGTSAGGINGVFLAKALAHDRSLDQLEKLWVREGDVEKLLNDRLAVRDGVPPDLADVQPASLLSGQRFYWELLNALEGMDDAPSARGLDGGARAPYVDEIDLYVTATDFQGATMPLALFDNTIDEPVHRKLFHFCYRHRSEPRAEHDDFGRDVNPMLAFGARCTASFPGAFSPFKLEDIDLALENHASYAHRLEEFGSASERWRAFFEGYPAWYAKRYFVDGGYLDNKPFDAAVRALSSRHHVLLPVDRKLIYIEPDPDRRGRDKEIPRPDVVSTLTAVATLPRVETIRAEIDEITRRNHIYDRASMLTAAVEEDAGRQATAAGGQRATAGDAGRWALKDLKDLIAVHGLAYGGYHRLKVSSITDWLARCLFGVAASDGTTIDTVRTWVGDWRDKTYGRYYTAEQRAARDCADEQIPLPLLETRLLIDLDVAYRLRRLEFVRLKLHELLKSPQDAAAVLKLSGAIDGTAAQVDPAAWSAGRKALVDLQKELDACHQALLALDQACLTLSVGPPPPLADAIGQPSEDFNAHGDGEHAPALLRALADTVGAHLTRIGDWCRSILGSSVQGSTDYVGKACATLVHLYRQFDDFDLVGFPLLYCLGTEELSRVEVFRVSAADTKLSNEGAQKLAGVRLGHFGAFLDPRWRENDILWGRLDGAERIVAAVAAGADNVDVQATQDALFERIVEDRRKALSVAPAAASAGAAATRPRVAIAEEVRGLTAATALPPERTLRLLGRSTAVVRGLVGGVADARGAGKSVVIAWTLRLLLVVWGLVEAAVPKSLVQVVARYWLELAMLSGGVLVGIGYLLGRGEEKVLGVALLGLAVLVRLALSAITAAAARAPRVRVRWPWLVALTLICAGGFGLFAPLARAKFGSFDGLDFQLALTYDRVADLFRRCVGRCPDQVTRAIWFDFGLLASYGLGLWALMRLARGLLVVVGSETAAWVTKHLALCALGAALADTVENFGMLTTLYGQLWRDKLEGRDAFLAHLVPGLTFAASATKWFLILLVLALGGLALLGGLATAGVRAIARRWARRAAIAPRSEPPPPVTEQPPAAPASLPG
jgi:patatin-related protein